MAAAARGGGGGTCLVAAVVTTTCLTLLVSAQCPSPDPCLNGGSCQTTHLPITSSAGYCCQCAAGFQGNVCSVVQPTGAACRWCQYTSCITGQEVTQTTCPKVSCFHGSNTVHSESRGRILISQLHVGERVMYVEESGHTGYTPVYLLAHSDPGRETQFVQVAGRAAVQTQTQPLQPLNVTLTPDHYLYVQSPGVDSGWSIRRADHVTSGDRMLYTGQDGAVYTVYIEGSVERVHGTGVYSPVTASGSILVNSVHTSVYSDDTQPLTATHVHVLLTLARAVASTLTPLLHLTTLTTHITQHNQCGIPAWIERLYQVQTWITG